MFNPKKNLKLIIFFVFLFSLAFIFIDSNALLAATTDSLGINAVDSEIVLASTDPRTVVVRIINIFLGILGIVAVSLIIFAGFTWMTSEGNEEKVSKAKGILKSAVVGLIIVLSAWGIVSFIFKEIAGGGSESSLQNSNSSFFQNGIGAVGACTVESVYPEPGQKSVPRNTMIMITFKEEVSSSTVLANSSICLEQEFSFEDQTCSNPVDFSLSTEDNKIFVIFPNSLLGNEDGFSSYVVYFSNDVLKLDESESIFDTCAPQYLLWNFEVSNQLDLTPPKIESIFPQADNQKDQLETSSLLEYAEAQISVVGIPNYFKPAEITSVTSGGGTSSSASGEINPNYNGEYTNFTVTIPTGADNKAQLMGGSVNLGAFDIIENKVNFTNYFSLELEEGFSPGNSWSVQVKKMVPADKIKVGPYEYTFIDGDTNSYNIGVRASNIGQAEQIYIALNDHPNVDVSYSSNVISLVAKTGGSSGNSIALQSYTDKIQVVEFSGGADRVDRIIVGDKKDKPMNATIQINFNEAINPLTVSGTSAELEDYLRVINVSDGGSIVSGKFVISSNYKTVEFVSDFKCGANSCGGDVFCLPANSNIKVEVVAAGLFDCEGDGINCANKSPFVNCPVNICQNDEGKRYPLSAMPASGAMDSSANSLDGNGDGYSYGPASYYYKNQANPLTGDSFSWSFWINDKIDSEPPVILEFTPTTPANLFSSIEIIFNKLISTDSLRTGQTLIESGEESVAHNRINILSGQLVGYWISFENQDTNPVDGDPDRTKVFINHARFFEGAGYRSQAGSGVKDIYQNCFKPSASINCNANPLNPSCCDGSPSSGADCSTAD
ncbi:hypothetical protein CVU82_00595 [Candidatus Falkowbacteria bacterium HGW-Falkowbacteria-1]|uniref:SbsA Ig-like domain-containing protein n=1 Tax=Candidatus Falkowbacteria bacterium HGW-Falkowbacteria-1 TaxID=2013768 RepID=A0A2N2EAC4_9BACT|nr:MAG: hypothetical protein CVU82_00595 [Candidatus Falkowbacteria bacterium HGW-Falkowbacteria-1]